MATDSPSKPYSDDDPTADLWLFGYGSLMFKTNFTYTEWHPAYVRGFMRRFWQSSTDHRGVPGAPGRVVTMMHVPDAPRHAVCGIVFRIPAAEKPKVLAALDIREKGGYTRHDVPCYRFCPEAFAKDVENGPEEDGEAITPTALCYIATPDNEEFVGEEPVEDLAALIARSEGPSGRNSEYLIKTAESLRHQRMPDPHIFELERRVKGLLGITEEFSTLKTFPL